MSVTIINKITKDQIDTVISNRGYYISPSENYIDYLTERITHNDNNALWRSRFTTLDQFFKNFIASEISVTSDVIIKYLIYNLMQETELKYFEAVKRNSKLIEEFYSAITRLRNSFISANKLEDTLQRIGSLKEFDLLTIYRKYEDAITKYNFTDQAGLYGQSLANLNRNIKEKLNSTDLIIFDGFELITPQLETIINTLNKTDTHILIRRDKMPVSDVYRKYLNLIHRLDESIEIEESPTNTESYHWDIPCSIKAHSCRTYGNESRLIAGMIAESRDNVRIVVAPNSEIIETVLTDLENMRAIPSSSRNRWGGKTSAILDAVKGAPSEEALCDTIYNILESSRTTLQNSPDLPRISENINQAHFILEEYNTLKDRFRNKINLESLKNILLGEVNSVVAQLPETSNYGIEWQSINEDNIRISDITIIPESYEGNIPPESSTSIFFQDSEFQPANAPPFFAALFPQRDVLKAKNYFQLRKNLFKTKKEVIFTFSNTNPAGKERYPTSFFNILNVDIENDIRQEDHISPLILNKKLSSSLLKEKILTERESHDLQTSEKIRSSHIKKEIYEQFSNKAFSASQLERYARCPYQYFLNKVACLEPIEPPTPEISPKHRGTIIHYILELFFSGETEELLRYMRREIQETQLLKNIPKYTETACNVYGSYLENTHSSILNLFKKRTIDLCSRTIMKEVDYIVDMEFPLLPAYTECEFGVGETSPLIMMRPPLKKSANIKGIIDRIDIDKVHKRFSIVDYKTGDTKSIISRIKKGEHLQLPLYIQAASELLVKGIEPVGAFLFSLKMQNKKHGMAKKEHRKFYFKNINARAFVKNDDWTALVDTASDYAAKYINNIRNAVFTENRESCKKLCDFKEICRYVET